GLGDELHVAVLDAVVDHLHVMAGAAGAHVVHAGPVVDLGGDFGQHRGQVLVRTARAAGHERRAVARALLAARDAHSHVPQAGGFVLTGAALGVGEVLVAAVYHQVAGFETGAQRGKRVVDGCARLYHKNNAARALEGRRQLGRRLGPDDLLAG